MNNVIMDDIAAGHFDRELGAIARDPEYAEYTAIELKSILTDRISDSMLTVRHGGLRWVYFAAITVLVVLLGVAITVGG